MLMEKEVFFKRDWASRMRSWIRYSARPIPISRLKSREMYSGLRYSALEISERLIFPVRFFVYRRVSVQFESALGTSPCWRYFPHIP